jgi:hypothetical protein
MSISSSAELSRATVSDGPLMALLEVSWSLRWLKDIPRLGNIEYRF